MSCEEGSCIAGTIGSQLVTARYWTALEAAFEITIDNFNEVTKRFAVPHPGWLTRAKFCVRCGEPLNVTRL